MKYRGTELIEVGEAIRCKIIKRLNKFVVRMSINGREDLAFVQNTGRLQQYLQKGRTGYCMRIEKPKKLAYRLFAVDDGHYASIIDTSLQERSFEKALEKELLSWLRGYRVEKRNTFIFGSRIDYLLRRGSDEAFLELKSAVMRLGIYAAYPDCPSARAIKQLESLKRLAIEGKRAFLVFIAAVPGVCGFKLNYEADPKLCNLIREAASQGVFVRSFSIAYSPINSTVTFLDDHLPMKI